MIFLWVVAIISLIFGALFLFFPKKLEQLNKFANQVIVYSDERLYKGRVKVGICLWIMSLVCFLVIYYVSKR